MNVKPPDTKQSSVRNPSPRTKKIVAKNNTSIIRNYLKENVTSDDAMLDTLCKQLHDLGIDGINDFKDLEEEDVDKFGLKKIIKKKMMKLVTRGGPTTTTTTTTITDKWDFFISHAQNDGALFAEGIYSGMKFQLKKTCWFDVKMEEHVFPY